MSHKTLFAIGDELDRERYNLQGSIGRAFGEAHALVVKAFRERDAGNIAEARILLNEAIDIECDVTGDCKVLGDLFEEWGGDHERDQRPERREHGYQRVQASVWEDQALRANRPMNKAMNLTAPHPAVARPGFTVDGECLCCGAMHAEGPCP